MTAARSSMRSHVTIGSKNSETLHRFNALVEGDQIWLDEDEIRDLAAEKTKPYNLGMRMRIPAADDFLSLLRGLPVFALLSLAGSERIHQRP